MGFRLRKTIPLGPLRLHLNQAGRITWGLKIGPWTWSATTRRHTLNTPGPGSVSWPGRRGER
ncbi:DUF4236 domain-containing protein [Pseudonocardia sp. KRD-184]|uniref:DUF4236 domain-containing protein n=1 Tax=Pseudonocardia oceani TaxID=2792013 RepID=A0ABS6UK01_9PSEU|nr:DUF4236 domain-containing protein [Pseudonocardia oceani]MBW0090509.1 DUF4236 domain-containing protein [Pseudonocardia oceani]MBW0098538.1 DUF4236 domain-containing protein [Pseudonocardia oceani]MBW0124378.1 DUF4236 domain-containing protein [Pseudonocardia oceani]MBW0131148.1 DUF4236 domain-containing protein [Pseudonocardia oceani]MBW0132590.1 DUF4236 domain-containing protein [Pseudonocardia oceani]